MDAASQDFLSRFTSGLCFSRSSRFNSSSFDEESTWRTALSNRPKSFLPGTCVVLVAFSLRSQSVF
jgi:hypothetical protein